MKILLAFASLGLAASTAACTTDGPSQSQHLDLSIDTQDRVAGQYDHYDIGLSFDFRRDPAVNQHYFILEAESGMHLMTVASAGGWRFLNVLDGAYTSAGPVGGEQKTTGDVDALSQVYQYDEMKLLEPLQLALTAHGVDSDLMDMPLANPNSNTQQLWMPMHSMMP